MLTERRILVLMVWCGWASIAQCADLYSISPGSVTNPDIVWSRSIPIADEEMRISARVRGQGEHPVPVRFVLKTDDGTPIILEAKLRDRRDGAAADYEASLRPTRAGIYQLTVQVDSELKSGDMVRENNTATVTLPVVWRELHVIPWGPTKYLKWVTAVPHLPADRATGDYWGRRGVKVLGLIHPLERHMMRLSEEEMISTIVGEADARFKDGIDGLILDEIGSYGTPEGLEFIRRFGLAFDKVREKYPQLQVYTWIAGPLNRQEIENGVRNDQILMGECYDPLHATHGPTWRDRLNYYTERLGPRNLIAVGTGRDAGRKYKPWVENSIRMIRTLGPDMPGICYYVVGEGENYYQGSFNEFLDGLTFKYFIMPVLSLNELQAPSGPVKLGEAISLRALVRNVGGVPAKNVGIRFYVRDVEVGTRSLIASTTVPTIGNGTEDQVENERVGPTFAAEETVLDGVRHQMWRFGRTKRVLVEQAIVDAQWTPEKIGRYNVEVEVQPSKQYTILQGWRDRTIEVVAKPPTRSPSPEVCVTGDDIWLSSYAPTAGEEIAVQVGVHNVSGAPAEKMAVKIFARSFDTDQRVLLKSAVIKRIGTEPADIQEKTVESADSKVVDGTKHPIARWGQTTRVFYNRALIDTKWTPNQDGYYRIEVEIQPSHFYTIRKGEGLATKIVPVGQ